MNKEVIMQNGLKILAALVLIGVLAVGGFLLYIDIKGGSGEKSKDTVAPTLEADEDAGQKTYRIDLNESEVKFQLQEDLRGTRTDVIGTTNEVAGDILVDFNNPSQSQVGMIRVNARTLETPEELRNKAIRANILKSGKDEYEYIEFTPTQLLNFPENPQIGQPLTFQIVGDLRIREITKSVTFDATVTLVSEERMEGTATAQILREDFDLNIPNAPGVANVTNEVQLTIQFVANYVLEDTSTPTETATEASN
jgi:polyisoprenoid-binding protein YceI